MSRSRRKSRKSNKKYSTISKIKYKWRKSSAAVKVTTVLITAYLVITIGGSVRYHGAYSNLEDVFSLSGYTQPIERSFIDTFWEIVTNPKDAWYFFRAKKEVIYLEVLIRYGKEVGIDTREYEETLAMGRLIDSLS